MNPITETIPAILSTLICPKDGSALTPEILQTDAQGRPESGFLIGKTQTYPLVLGIPRLIDDNVCGPLVAMIKRGDTQGAADLALSWPDKNLSNRVRRKLTKIILGAASGVPLAQKAAASLSTGRRLQQSTGSVESMLRELQSGFFIDWLLHRFNARTFRPLMSFTTLLRPNDMVLDVGGGFGHGAWVLSGRVNPEQIVMMDSVFSHLHVARTRMVPGVTCVAADVDQGLPISDIMFDAVVMSDTFHFVANQKRLAQDVTRVLSKQGRLILSQLHNGLIQAEFSGSPRSPQGYLELFPDLQRVIVRNTDVQKSFAEGTPLVLPSQTDFYAVDRTSELSLIADRDGQVLTQHPAAAIDTRNLRLASVLRQSDQGMITLNTDIAEVVQNFLEWPDCTDLTASKISDRSAEENVRSGVLVSVPSGYFDN